MRTARLTLFSAGTLSSLVTYTAGTQQIPSVASSALFLLTREAEIVKEKACPNSCPKMKLLRTATVDNTKCLFTIYQISASPGMCLLFLTPSSRPKVIHSAQAKEEQSGPNSHPSAAA